MPSDIAKPRLGVTASESDLLHIIKRGLTTEKDRQLKQLQEKLRAESISERERAQLLRLTEELEKLGVERLQALIELAAIRKTSVSDLTEKLNLAECAYA